jgi:hypothetical protein
MASIRWTRALSLYSTSAALPNGMQESGRQPQLDQGVFVLQVGDVRHSLSQPSARGAAQVADRADGPARSRA